MGKTTLCKILCNEFCEKSHVKSSHVELGSKSSTELLKGVLKDLTNNDHDFVNGLIEDKCWDFLKATCKQKIFLAIDNAWPDLKSREEAKKYLKLGKEVHKESVVIVTSRALKTLTSLGVRKEDCFAMPSLEKKDAKKLFLCNHATSGNRVLNKNDEQVIKKCIDLCYFSKARSNDGHYLPLALKALGLQLGNRFGKRPSEWVKALEEVKDFNPLEDEENPVFDILRTSFDSLKSTEQDLFMDLVIFTPRHSKVDEEAGLSLGLMDWLAVVHNQSLLEIGNRVQRLNERGLVEDVDMGGQQVYMHDLYREFANLEASGKLKDLDFKKRKWAYYKNSYTTECLKMMPSRGRWQNLTRFGIQEECPEEECPWEEMPRRLEIERIKWSYLSDVVVLKVCCDLHQRDLDLNLKGLGCLKSLDLHNVCPLDIRDGLQNLEHLVYFKCFLFDEAFLDKLPASLEVLLLEGSYGLSLGSGVFDLCSNLAKLELIGCRAGNLDFRNCSSLQRLQLKGLHQNYHPDPELVLSELSLDGLQDLSKLTVFRWKHLDYVDEAAYFYNVHDKVHRYELKCQLPASLQVLEIDENVSLRSDVFARCTKLSQLNLTSCHATSLNLRNCKALETVKLENVERLHTLSGLSSSAATLKRLEVNGCDNLDRIPGLDRLVGLRDLHLRNLCVNRNLRLLDLNYLTKLEELHLDGTDVELREEDVCVLASLRRLNPVGVAVGKFDSYSSFSVDVKRRKVLRREGPRYWDGDSWRNWEEWDEVDLGELPISCGSVEVWARKF